MVKLSLFLFSTDVLITQQKCGCWLYFHLKNASRMLHAIVLFYAQGLLLWPGYHLPSWGREILLYLEKPCPSRMHGLEKKMEGRKEGSHYSSQRVSPLHRSLCVQGMRWGSSLTLDCQSDTWYKGTDDFLHIQMKPEEVFRQGQSIWVRT